ncbi:MAG: hypothetical protein QOH41_2707, partial [Blastocatellia bacterium]|nr:hypothetical protein [Blastocatellia bacterium]
MALSYAVDLELSGLFSAGSADVSSAQRVPALASFLTS